MNHCSVSESWTVGAGRDPQAAWRRKLRPQRQAIYPRLHRQLLRAMARIQVGCLLLPYVAPRFIRSRMTDWKTKIKEFYVSRDKSELLNRKPKGQYVKKTTTIKPSIQAKRGNERLQSPGKSYDLGPKRRGDGDSFDFRWLDTSVVQEWNIFMVPFPYFFLLSQYLCTILRFWLALFWKS